jgi:hypothetical protein
VLAPSPVVRAPLPVKCSSTPILRSASSPVPSLVSPPHAPCRITKTHWTTTQTVKEDLILGVKPTRMETLTTTASVQSGPAQPTTFVPARRAFTMPDFGCMELHIPKAFVVFEGEHPGAYTLKEDAAHASRSSTQIPPYYVYASFFEAWYVFAAYHATRSIYEPAEAYDAICSLVHVGHFEAALIPDFDNDD